MCGVYASAPNPFPGCLEFDSSVGCDVVVFLLLPNFAGTISSFFQVLGLLFLFFSRDFWGGRGTRFSV